MARPTSLPTQATDNAAGQAELLPDELPPPPPAPPSLPEDANISELGIAGLPDWLA